jgi:hypothetical protein
MVSIQTILSLEQRAAEAARARPQAARPVVRLIADRALGETVEGVVAAWKAANPGADGADVFFIVRDILLPPTHEAPGNQPASGDA